MQFLCIGCTLYLFGVASALQDLEVTQYGIGFVGGDPTTIDTVPYQAAVLTEFQQLLRCGSIIGKKYILTSAFVSPPAKDNIAKVRVGSSDPTQGGQLINVEEVIKHEDFDNLYTNDVALLRLSEEIRYGDTVKPIKMASSSADNATSAVVSGFYPPLKAENNPSYYLKKASQDVISRTSCAPYYEENKITFTESYICGYNATACCCNRDHGAPLVQDDTLIALFIGGSFCCDPANPQIYTDVSTFKGWAEELMKARGYDAKQDETHYYTT